MNPFAELAEVAATFAALYGVALLAAALRRPPPPAPPGAVAAQPVVRDTAYESGPVTFGPGPEGETE